MADVRPFCALRPRDDLAGVVIAPPYDVLSDAQARAFAADRRSFVRVTRGEVDLPEGANSHSEAAYAAARRNLDAFRAEGWLAQDAAPTYYLYGQVMGDHQQVGIIAAASVAEYDDGRIARHELTRPDKEDDRTHHMDVLDAQVGLVFLAYRPTAALTALLAALSAVDPAWEVTTEDEVVHRLWPVPAAQVEPLRDALSELDRLYIADGHHRSAAASRIHAARGDEASAYFLSGLYPADQLQVLAYNRLVRDLNGHTQDAFLAALSAAFEVSPGGDTPAARGEIAMVLGGKWWRLVARPHVRSDDPVEGLDVAILQREVLAPLLGIDDPRRSTRISFMGGIHGPAGLERAVACGGAAVGFHLVPTGLDQLFAVADAGDVMPPKSTWFEPKLREGVAVRSLRSPA